MREQNDEATRHKIQRIQEKMQAEIELTEKSETEMRKKGCFFCLQICLSLFLKHCGVSSKGTVKFNETILRIHFTVSNISTNQILVYVT